MTEDCRLVVEIVPRMDYLAPPESAEENHRRERINRLLEMAAHELKADIEKMILHRAHHLARLD